MTIIEEVRSFNRFYTQEIGLLAGHLPASDLSLAEARVMYELAQGGEQTASDIGARLKMDKAHISRIVARFKLRGLVQSAVSPTHGKRQLLLLTDAGRQTFAVLDRGTSTQIEHILAPLDQHRRHRLVAAMHEVKSLLGREPTQSGTIRLRGLAAGDIGWITHRQAVLYNREYGWDQTYEGLAAEILAKFVANFDPEREDCWVAEQDGSIVGSTFLMKSDDPATAKLRLLYVEPAARGRGIGRMLVDACTSRAQALGYRKITLWTNDILVAARRIYAAAGFRLIDATRHHSFGHDLVGETWTRTLTPSVADDTGQSGGL